MPAATQTTHGIRVDVDVEYSREHSRPHEGTHFFIYHIRITNDGHEPVTLRSRHWKITDARGELQEVRGPGVVGEQPRIEPGRTFSYSSGCPLPTPFGGMVGTYRMERDDGGRFDVAIPEFALIKPNAAN